MRRIVLILVVLSLSLLQAVSAWGGGSSSGGSRLKSTPPPKTNRPLPPTAPSLPPEHRHVVSAVSYHVQFKSKDDWFPVADPSDSAKQWLLKASKAPEVKKLSETQYEVLSHFDGKLEGGEEALVPAVVLFKLEGKGDVWKVKESKLVSVGGKAI